MPQPKPWYREPWPWLLMAGPAVVVVAGLVTAYIAVVTDDGLVASDYYRQGLAINATLAREERARQLGLIAVLQLSPQRDGIRLTLAGAAGRTGRLRLTLVHPTRAGYDQSVMLAQHSDGSFSAALKPVETHAWQAVLEDRSEGWRLVGVLPAHADRLELSAQAD